MKTLKTFILVAACSINLANANDFQGLQVDLYKTGKVSTYNEPEKVPSGCDLGVNVVIDEAKLSGRIVNLKNFVEGFCEIAVVPNDRFYHVSRVSPAGCGSVKIEAIRMTQVGEAKLEILDHRSRLCQDMEYGRVVVTEKLATGLIAKTSGIAEEENFPVTCMAYWEGYEFNSETGSCVKLGTSGCQDPFQFSTLEQCESAHNL